MRGRSFAAMLPQQHVTFVVGAYLLVWPPGCSGNPGGPSHAFGFALGYNGYIHLFFYKGQFIRAKMMSTENFGKNKGQSLLNFLDVKGQAVRGK